ncbi:MAG TPA: leucine-rich repeat domain-containing protein [Pirellulales bacterium]|jgi:hypothetical protein|nr:leucine-rich repeat domain-containing protein [Pirellulales bacterium]
MLKGMAGLLTTLKPKHRWMQFSLRTVLVLVTLLCIALGLWVVPAERQRRAVAAIQELDGRVSYVEADPASEMFPLTFLRRWLPPDYFNEIKYIALYRSKDTDAGLAHLQGLTSLQRLYLDNTQVTDAGLTHLHGLTSLQGLYLDNTQVTDAGLAALRKALPHCQIFGP